MTINFDDIGIYDESGYAYDGGEIGNWRRDRGKASNDETARVRGSEHEGSARGSDAR